MIQGSFIAYRGPAELHDSTVASVKCDGDRTVVLVELFDGGTAEITFSETEEVIAKDAEGMMLYALAELQTEGAGRRFVFVNWEETSTQALEIRARSGRWRVGHDLTWKDL